MSSVMSRGDETELLGRFLSFNNPFTPQYHASRQNRAFVRLVCVSGHERVQVPESGTGDGNGNGYTYTWDD